MRRWRPPHPPRLPSEGRSWVHPSELPSFESLATTASVHTRSRIPRVVAGVMAILLIVGALVLTITRGAVEPVGDTPAHLAATLAALPASSQTAAAHTVDLTVTVPGHAFNVAAIVLSHDLAVTTTVIPADALITGSSATKINFPVTLVGRDNVMGFSIVRLGIPLAAVKLDPMPASTIVTAVAPIVKGSTDPPEYNWTMTTLGDPLLSAQGVVRYLATETNSSLATYVDAIAVDKSGRVVAVLSSRHQWYAAQFVAQVANVVATGRGCHADLGIKGTSEQGGGVLVTSVVPYSAAEHAGVAIGDVITGWDGTNLNTWNQLASTLYLTPAYTQVHFTFDHQSQIHHAYVALGCAP